MNKVLQLIAILGLCLISTTGHAAAYVSVTPSNISNHPINTNPIISLTWTVISGGNEGLGGQTSTVGTFYTPANTAMSPTTGTISIPQASCGASATCPVIENLLIPASIISQAQTNGYSFITYQRIFTGSMESASATVTINFLYPIPTVTASPATFNYFFSLGSPINIAWQVTTYGNGAGEAYFDDGSFADAPDGNSNLPVTGTLTLPPLPLQPSGTSTAFETLTLTQEVLDYAQQNNLSTIYYGRPYYNDNTGISGELYIRINLLTSIANPNAALTINRVALRFSDNASVKVIQPDTSIMAVADVSYTGSGLFDAMWEIAEPVSTMGQPLFVAMQPVRQFLVAGGRVYLQTPPLPAQKQGLHILRLKVCSPAIAFGEVVGLCRVAAMLQYSVNPQGDVSGVMSLPPVRLNAPVDKALLATDTRFDWQPVKGARAYQLELFLPEQAGLKPDDAAIAKRAPASGMMVPAKKNSLTLGELSRNKLRPNTTYYWRIIAIGNNGQILSASALRGIRIP